MPGSITDARSQSTSAELSLVCPNVIYHIQISQLPLRSFCLIHTPYGRQWPVSIEMAADGSRLPACLLLTCAADSYPVLSREADHSHTAPGAAHTAHAEQNTALDVEDLEVKLAGTFLFKPKVDLFPGHGAVFQPSALLKVTDGHCILIWILSPENALCMKKMQANVIVKKQASVLAIACPRTQE